jgi:hypothetical protein
VQHDDAVWVSEPRRGILAKGESTETPSILCY